MTKHLRTALWGVQIIERQLQLHSLLLGDPMTDPAITDHFMNPLCPRPGTASTRRSPTPHCSSLPSSASFSLCFLVKHTLPFSYIDELGEHKFLYHF